MTEQSGAIFVCHATSDAALAGAFVSLLKAGLEIPRSSIFCSSLLGHGITPGEDWRAFIRLRLQSSGLGVLLITPALIESSFCGFEIGALWALGTPILPLRHPLVPSDKIPDVVHRLQYVGLRDRASLTGLLDKFSRFSTVVPDSGVWVREIDRFMEAANGAD